MCPIHAITEWHLLGPDSFTPYALVLPYGRFTRERREPMGLTVFPLFDLQPVRVLSMHRWTFSLRAVDLALQQPIHVPFGPGVYSLFHQI